VEELALHVIDSAVKVSRPIRTLIVDDFDPWRKHVCSVLGQHAEFEILAEASDGQSAVTIAQRLRPDLVLLDIGLPVLNGIRAAELIRTSVAEAKILFLSENCDPDVATAALTAGGNGYVVKSDCATELSVALQAVIQGEQFVSSTIEAALNP
jgi:DNA-binding NarL/FixJ family response regulator